MLVICPGMRLFSQQKNESSQFLLEMNPLKRQIIVKWLHIYEDLMTVIILPMLPISW
jgi:hypothetical protein